MASNFSANQFEKEFTASRLKNWEVPRWHRARPVQRKSATKIITNNRGHLLPGVVRPKSSPWGNFKTTWDLPDKITKQKAIELHSPVVGFNRWNKPPEHFSNKNGENLAYVPGDLTNPEQHHHTRSTLTKGDHQLPILNDLYIENHKCCDEIALLNDRTKAKQILEIPSKHNLNGIEQLSYTEADNKMRLEVTEKPSGCNTVPLIPAYCNFQSARKMAQENLEHQPLPDSIMDRAFRKMQAQGIVNPELALDVEPIATGVGVKTYNAGPTHCTKLKVYRPKTCGIVPKPFNNQKSYYDDRPQTAFDNTEKMGPMDLAICWDYRPTNPRDEPKPPAHIDGSNGSVAPAVFTVVKTPRPSNEEYLTGRSGGVFSNTLGDEGFFDKDIMLRNKNYFSTQLAKHTNRACRCGNSAPVCRSNSATRNMNLIRENLQMANRCKSSPNLSIIAQASEQTMTNDNVIVCNYNKEHYHFRPESHNHQHHHQHNRNQNQPKQSATKCKKHKCEKSKTTNRLCEQNNINANSHADPIKIEYKLPFKAGIPKSNSSGVCSSFDNCSNGSSSTESAFTSKTIKIPKPRNPYAKKNYVIDTLAPPFACWKGGAGQGGYPEHWRLASVYQHAYKPVEQRKRPLLATVYQ